MTKHIVLCSTLIILFAPVVAAQKWEIGAGVGGGYYTSQEVKGPVRTGSANIAGGLAASAWLDNHTSRRWGGELRYDYQMGNLQVSSQSNKAAFGAQTHAIHYDFLYHTAPSEATIRPFVSFGGGVKLYQGTGTEVISQPVNDVALLTKASDTQGMVSVGAGIKIARGRTSFRLEIHDFITPFPTKVIVPAQNASIGGWLHDFVAGFGLGLLF